jgi:malonate transporter MadL subunit
LNTQFTIGDISEKGISFWSLIYIPIVVAMAAKQNVIGALDGGLMAIVGGIIVVTISFIFVPIITNYKK